MSELYTFEETVEKLYGFYIIGLLDDCYKGKQTRLSRLEIKHRIIPMSVIKRVVKNDRDILKHTLSACLACLIGDGRVYIEEQIDRKIVKIGVNQG